jgi:hypothetical protein
MPDFSMNIDYGKPQNQMSLGDIVQLARGAQAYQQAEQTNPLALQKARMEIEQAQKLNPLAVRKATAETGTAEIGQKKSQLELDQSHFNLAGNVLSGLEARAITLAEKKDSATAMKELKAAEQWLNASGVPSQEKGAFKMAEQQLKNNDFAGYQATLENMRNILGGAASRYQANLPQTAEVGGAPAVFNRATGVAKPLPIAGQPQQPNMGAGGQAPAGVTATQMELQYPVRKAGDIRPLAPSEAADMQKGQAYRDSLVSHASNLTTSKRNIDEVIKKAQNIGEKEWAGGAGVLGSAGRNLSTFLGTEQGVAYKELSKDLANVQIANMKAMGMSTDADKTLQAAANGDFTYPPDVLMNIARRAQADMTNIELQAKGAQNFAKKYGDSNLKTFQDQWSSNAQDSRVFEAIAINNSDLPREEKIKKIDKLFEGVSAAQIDKLTKQKNRLLKLSTTGEL